MKNSNKTVIIIFTHEDGIKRVLWDNSKKMKDLFGNIEKPFSIVEPNYFNKMYYFNEDDKVFRLWNDKKRQPDDCSFFCVSDKIELDTLKTLLKRIVNTIKIFVYHSATKTDIISWLVENQIGVVHRSAHEADEKTVERIGLVPYYTHIYQGLYGLSTGNKEIIINNKNIKSSKEILEPYIEEKKVSEKQLLELADCYSFFEKYNKEKAMKILGENTDFQYGKLEKLKLEDNMSDEDLKNYTEFLTAVCAGVKQIEK